MFALFAWSAVAQAGGLVEIEYAPAGRGDLAWNQSGQQSGTLVAEGDGFLVPTLRASSPLRSRMGGGRLGSTKVSPCASTPKRPESSSSEICPVALGPVSMA